jgi:uncharacterized SAM-binding protein YcdF (DUF218 family)
MKHNIEAITNFVFISDELSKSDIIIVPGTNRIHVVKKALELYRKGFAPYIITTGGVHNAEGLTESEFQKQYLVGNGVPEDKIFNETKSTNTKENAIYAKEKLDKEKIKYNRIILVSKTYHARRILMTFLASFSNSDIRIASVIDDREITKYNWFKNKEKKDKVMEEVEKIGKYFLKGDLSL